MPITNAIRNIEQICRKNDPVYLIIEMTIVRCATLQVAAAVSCVLSTVGTIVLYNITNITLRYHNITHYYAWSLGEVRIDFRQVDKNTVATP